MFEALLRFLGQLPEAELRATSFGCFDYEPYGTLMRFPVHMIRQRHRQLIRRAYELLERKAAGNVLLTVEPELFRADIAQLPPVAAAPTDPIRSE